VESVRAQIPTSAVVGKLPQRRVVRIDPGRSVPGTHKPAT
jgi:hypothetical protein